MLLVPGLWTKWYPLYWVHLRSALDRCAVDYHFSRADSDATSVRTTGRETSRRLREKRAFVARGFVFLKIPYVGDVFPGDVFVLCVP